MNFSANLSQANLNGARGNLSAMQPAREGFGGVNGMNISGHLSAIAKPDKMISDAGRKSNLTKSVAAPVSRSQN